MFRLPARRFARLLSAPKRPASTHVAALVHDQLGVTLPHNRRAVILPDDVGYAYNDLLAGFRNALKSDKPDIIYGSFMRLHDAGHADNIGPEDIRAIDSVIAPTVWRLPDPPLMLQPIEDHEPPPRCVDSPEQYHELGLWLALRGRIGLLRACMIRALSASNPKPVIELWGAYEKRSLAGEGSQNLEELPHQLPTHLDSPTLLTYYPGRPELLTLTICAYTMLDDFRSAFHTAHRTLIPLKPLESREALDPLISVQEAVVSQTLRNLEDLRTLRSLARPASLRNHIMDAVETKSPLPVQRLFDSIVKLLRAADPWIGPLDSSSGPPTISTAPDAKPLFSISRQTWCDLIEASSALYLLLPGLTQSIWAEFGAHGASPTAGMWNTLMAGYAMNGDFTKAWAVWNQMGPEMRDEYTYTTMIQALFERRESDQATKLFDELKAFAQERGEEVGIKSYNVLLHGLFTSGRIQYALDLFSKLTSSPPESGYPTADTTTFNTQLRYYARQRDMHGLSSVLKSMADLKVEPDVYTYVTILDVLLAAGSQDAGKRILEIMRKFGVEPNAAIVNVLLESIVRPASPIPTSGLTRSQRQKLERRKPQPPRVTLEHLHIAIKLLLAFELDAGVETNVVNYTALMAAFQRAAAAGHISHAEAVTGIKSLRERMRTRGIVPNRVTFNVLIKAALEGGPLHHSKWSSIRVQPGPIDLSTVPDNVSQAVKYLHEMRGVQIVPNHDTWWILLKGVASWGHIKLARTLCDEMVATGFIPQTGLLKLVLQIRGQ